MFYLATGLGLLAVATAVLVVRFRRHGAARWSTSPVDRMAGFDLSTEAHERVDLNALLALVSDPLTAGAGNRSALTRPRPPGSIDQKKVLTDGRRFSRSLDEGFFPYRDLVCSQDNRLSVLCSDNPRNVRSTACWRGRGLSFG
jgi:hypothetical protein